MHNYKNMVLEVETKEIRVIIEKITKDSELFLVALDGSEMQSWDEYISLVQESFSFPTRCNDSVDRYLDWMRDLSWIEAEGFVLVINDYNRFLQNKPDLKNEIIVDFSEVILPFWENEEEKM